MCAVMRSEGKETSVFYQLLPLLCHRLQQQLNLQPWTDQGSPSIRLSRPLLTPSADLVFLWLYSPLSCHTKEDFNSSTSCLAQELYYPLTQSFILTFYFIFTLCSFLPSKCTNSYVKSCKEPCLWLNKKSLSDYIWVWSGSLSWSLLEWFDCIALKCWNSYSML